jgi:hypothetical protein
MWSQIIAWEEEATVNLQTLQGLLYLIIQEE